MGNCSNFNGYEPNPLIAGIGVTAFGSNEVEDYTSFFTSLLLIIILEVGGIVIVNWSLQAKCNINFVALFVNELQFFGQWSCWAISFIYGAVFLTYYLPFGADFELEFSWL